MAGFTPAQGPTPQQYQDDEEAKRKAAQQAQINTVADQGAPTANFELTGKNAEQFNQGQQARRDATGRILGGPSTIADGNAAIAARAQQVAAVQNQQASNAGVEVADADSQAGGIAGFFGGHEITKHYTAGKTADTTTAGNKATLQQRIDQADSRPFAQATAASMQGAQGQGSQLDQSQANQFRSGQQNLAQMLTQSAQGNGPSAAQAQLQQATDQNLASQLALAKSGTGDRSAALKQALMNQATIGQQAASQSASLRAQEQQQAMGQLGGVLSGAREQDLGAAGQNANLAQQASFNNANLAQQTATTNATLQQQTNLANLGSQVDQQKQKDALIQTYLTQGMQLDQAQHAAEIQQAQFNAELLARQAAADKGVAMQSSAAAGQTAAATVGAVASGIASAVSDMREKKAIHDGTAKLEGFLGAIGTHAYKYKNPKAALRGEGEFVSPMAQELEKTELGKSMVRESPSGTKVVDYGKGLGTMMSSMAMLFKKVKKLERANA